MNLTFITAYVSYVYYFLEDLISKFNIIPEISEKDIVDTNGAGDVFVGDKITYLN